MVRGDAEALSSAALERGDDALQHDRHHRRRDAFQRPGTERDLEPGLDNGLGRPVWREPPDNAVIPERRVIRPDLEPMRRVGIGGRAEPDTHAAQADDLLDNGPPGRAGQHTHGTPAGHVEGIGLDIGDQFEEKPDGISQPALDLAADHRRLARRPGTVGISRPWCVVVSARMSPRERKPSCQSCKRLCAGFPQRKSLPFQPAGLVQGAQFLDPNQCGPPGRSLSVRGKCRYLRGAPEATPNADAAVETCTAVGVGRRAVSLLC
jgi:hypothetical protein